MAKNKGFTLGDAAKSGGRATNEVGKALRDLGRTSKKMLKR